MSTYGIARLDKVRSVYTGHIESVVNNDEVLQNGMVCMVGDLVTDERELRTAVKPITAKLSTDPLVLVAAPEVRYEEYLKSDNALELFATPAGTPARAYHLEKGDIFSVTEDMVDAIEYDAPEVGKYVVAQNDSFKLKEVEDYTDEVFVGKVIQLETIGTTTYVGSVAGGPQIGRTNNLVVIEVLKNHRAVQEAS